MSKLFKCSTCGKLHPVDAMGKNSKRPSGISSYCRACSTRRELARHARLSAMGLCIRCREPIDTKSRNHCSKCLEKTRMRMRVKLDYQGQVTKPIYETVPDGQQRKS